jgi:hypothetical protein
VVPESLESIYGTTHPGLSFIAPSVSPFFQLSRMEDRFWKPEEDAVVLKHVEDYGPQKWGLIPRMNEGFTKSGKACRVRWLEHLQEGINKAPFTEEEAELVERLQRRFGNRWVSGSVDASVFDIFKQQLFLMRMPETKSSCFLWLPRLSRLLLQAEIASYLHGRTPGAVKNLWNSQRNRERRPQSAMSSSSRSVERKGKEKEHLPYTAQLEEEKDEQRQLRLGSSLLEEHKLEERQLHLIPPSLEVEQDEEEQLYYTPPLQTPREAYILKRS